MSYVLQYSYTGSGAYITSAVAGTQVSDTLFPPIGAGKFLRLIGYKVSPNRANTAGAKFQIRIGFTLAGGFFATHVMAGGADLAGQEGGSGWVFLPEPGLFDVSLLNTNGLVINHSCNLAAQAFFLDVLYSIETTL